MGEARKRAGYLEGAVSIISNTLLFLVKYYLGTLYSSIAVLADAFHTLSDSLTSVVVVLGFKVAYARPDEEHPFGHGRAELVAALVIGVLLGVVAYDFAVASYNKLIAREPLVYSPALVWALAASAAVKEGLALWAFRLGEKYKSQSIKGDAWHHRSDAIATGLLALAIYLGGREWWVDGALGLAVSAIIFATSGKLVLEASSELIGRAPSAEELSKIVEIARSAHPKVLGVHHVHVHRYGDHVEVTLHVDLPDDATLRQAHEVSTKVEDELRKHGYEATVHVEPFKSKKSERGHVD